MKFWEFRRKMKRIFTIPLTGFFMCVAVGSVMGSVNGGFIPDDLRSHVSGYSLGKAGVNLVRSRSLADGQSQRSMSALSSHGRYLAAAGGHGAMHHGLGPMSAMSGMAMGLGVPNMNLAMSRPGGPTATNYSRQRTNCDKTDGQANDEQTNDTNKTTTTTSKTKSAAATTSTKHNRGLKEGKAPKLTTHLLADFAADPLNNCNTLESQNSSTAA